jgi:hypothetical protein
LRKQITPLEGALEKGILQKKSCRRFFFRRKQTGALKKKIAVFLLVDQCVWACAQTSLLSLLTRPAALLALKGFSEQINSSQVMSKVFFQKKANWCIKKKNRSISACRSMRLGLRPTEPSSLLTRPAALLGQKGFSEQINSSTSHVEGFFSEESKLVH